MVNEEGPSEDAKAVKQTRCTSRSPYVADTYISTAAFSTLPALPVHAPHRSQPSSRQATCTLTSTVHTSCLRTQEFMTPLASETGIRFRCVHPPVLSCIALITVSYIILACSEICHAHPETLPRAWWVVLVSSHVRSPAGKSNACVLL